MKQQAIIDMAKEIEDLVSHDFENLQDWNSMHSSWQVGETRRIGDTINTMVYKSETEMRFVTYIPPLAAFPKHWHDIAETCRVIAGILKDLLSGRVWKRDETAVFSRGQKHIPSNPDSQVGTWLEVNFHR